MTDWLRCECSRLVPPDEWVLPHECCEDCYWACDGDWRAAVVEHDRDRLIPEFVD